MILTFILQALFFVLNSVVSVLPSAQTLPTPIHDALVYFVAQLSGWTFIFPISTMFTILSYTLLIEVAYFAFDGVLWVYHKIRGI